MHKGAPALGSAILMIALSATADAGSDFDKLNVPSSPTAGVERVGDDEAVVAAAQDLQSLISVPPLEGFGSIRYGREPARVEVFWPGEPPVTVVEAIERVRESGIRVDLLEAPFSAAELRVESARLRELDTDQGGKLFTVLAELGDLSGIYVGVPPGGQERAVGFLTGPYEYEIEERDPAPALSRWDDIEPFWAGGAIDHSVGLAQYAYCTTGFAVKNSANREAMLTAQHCGTNWDWYTPIGDRFVGTTGTGNFGVDGVLLNGADYGPFVFTGPWTSSSAIGVAGSENPVLNSNTWVSGSWQGQNLVRVSLTNTYWDYGGGWRGPGFETKDDLGLGSVGKGDSGGPVFRTASGSAMARGIILAIDGGRLAPCVGRPSSACSDVAFHVNVTAILSALNATLQV